MKVFAIDETTDVYHDFDLAVGEQIMLVEKDLTVVEKMFVSRNTDIKDYVFRKESEGNVVTYHTKFGYVIIVSAHPHPTMKDTIEYTVNCKFATRDDLNSAEYELE
jgi:hypothetical protein